MLESCAPLSFGVKENQFCDRDQRAEPVSPPDPAQRWVISSPTRHWPRPVQQAQSGERRKPGQVGEMKYGSPHKGDPSILETLAASTPARILLSLQYRVVQQCPVLGRIPLVCAGAQG